MSGQTEDMDSVVQKASTASEGDEEKVAKDSIYLLNIFPEEVWLMILEPLREPDDLENLSNSSLFFRNLLQDKRVLFLFPKVWEILAVQYHQNYKTDHSFNEIRCVTNFLGTSLTTDNHRWRKSEDCGRLHGFQWYSGILRLRLVCQTWSKSIDHLFQNQEGFYDWILDPKMFTMDPMGFDVGLGSWISYSFQTNAYFVHFQQHFGKSHIVEAGRRTRNPFLNRAISISFGMDYSPEYFMELQRLLWTNGHHLWYCSVNLTLLRVQPVDGYLIMFGILRTLPNLKALCVDMPRGSCSAEGEDLLRAQIGTRPMPTLSHLRFLMVTQMHTLILNELIRSNSHVSILQVSGWRPLQDLGIHSIGMPNLTGLALVIHSEAGIELLESSPHANWNLQKLHLDLRRFTEINVSRLFTLLNAKWGNSIRELILDHQWFMDMQTFQHTLIYDQFSSLNLNLPNITRLELLTFGFFNLDFALPMKESLQVLDLTVQFQGDFGDENNKELVLTSDNDKEVKFFSCGDAHLESNIWTAFPKLKQVVFNQADWPYSRSSKVKIWSCSREEWTNKINRNIQ